MADDEYRRKPPRSGFTTQGSAPPGTRYEDGSVEGGRRAGDSADDFDSEGNIRSGSNAPIVW